MCVTDSGVINHQAQSNGGFPQHVISRNDIEVTRKNKDNSLFYNNDSDRESHI